MAIRVELYQVWSRKLSNWDRPILHTTCSEWNTPGVRKGAVQWHDAVRERYYRLGIRAHVCIRKIVVTVDE